MADQPDARVAMNDFLTSIGLGDLAGWAYDQFTNGNTPTQVYQNLRLQPAWQQRYQVIVQREANGLSPMSEADVLNYEKQAKALMQAAGMPASFYDQPEDFVALAGTHDKSVSELQQDIQVAYSHVANAPTEVRDYFASQYGAQGDSALAAYFLNPDIAEPVLEQQARAAEVGGYGLRAGIDVSKARAEEIGSLGLSTAEVRAGMGTAASHDALYHENIGEQKDLTAEGAGLDAALNLGGTGAADLAKRMEERTAGFNGVGATVGSKERTGLGAAD